MGTVVVPNALAVEIANVFEDPVLFAQRVLRHKTWWGQEQILRSAVQHRQTAVKGCHASTKSFSVAELALFVLTKAYVEKMESAIVVTLGPTARQVRLNIWNELRKAAVGGLVDYEQGDINQMELKISEKIYAIGFGVRADKRGGAVRLQGLHADWIVIIVDEAPGVEAEVYESIEGLRAGGKSNLILLGNPTVPAGKFYAAFTSERDKWNCITIDGLDTPNMKDVTLKQLAKMPLDEGGPLDENPMPFLITRRWMREALDNWGEENARFQSRARGKFPTQAEGALISLEWLEAAKYRELQPSKQRFSAGVDVAEAGEDETCLYIVDRGRIVEAPTCSTKQDARGDILKALLPHKRNMGTVRYDSIGVGAYFGPHLADHEFSTMPVNVGRASSRPKEFRRLRDQLYWELRELFRHGQIGGLEDETTIAQLAPMKYDTLPDGRTIVEDKKSYIDREGRSPDRGDALMLACTTGGGGKAGQGIMVAKKPSLRGQI